MEYLLRKRLDKKRITMLTCYDFPTAVLENKAGIDIIFVGDSVGTNVLGYKSEIEVTMADMIHHLKAVHRGVSNAYLLVDMPYKSYETPDQALENAKTFISIGADGVKLEGVKEEIVRYLVKHNIDVIGHIGLNPQTHRERRVQGKTFESAKKLIEGALILQNAGIKILVLELIPEKVAKIITEKLSIPTIGIAAGRYCDGQVLVINDLLGLTDVKLKHVNKYQNYWRLTFDAISRYREEVENGIFPAKENVILIKKEELAKIKEWLEGAK